MDINKISRKDILKKIDSLKDDNHRVYNSALAHMKNILNNFIKENGFENICELRNYSDVNRFEILIKQDNGYSYDIDVNFEKDWYLNDNVGHRVLSFNFCSFGSFYSNEMNKRDYLIVLGKLTEKMNELEKQMLDFDWEEYDEIRDKFHNANYELQAYDQEVENRKFNAKKNDIINKLKEGSMICIGKKSEFKEGSGYIKVDDIRKIERLGNKTINLSNTYHRIKKDYLVSMIADNKWKIVKGV